MNTAQNSIVKPQDGVGVGAGAALKPARLVAGSSCIPSAWGPKGGRLGASWRGHAPDYTSLLESVHLSVVILEESGSLLPGDW